MKQIGQLTSDFSETTLGEARSTIAATTSMGAGLRTNLEPKSSEPWRLAGGSATSPVEVGSRESHLSRHHALQALLAFSSLHTQVRQRRTQQEGTDLAGLVAEGLSASEQFALDEVLQLVAERARAITGADGIAIALAEGEEIVCRGAAGIIAPDAGVRLDPWSGFSGACFRTGTIIRCDNVEEDPRVNLQASLRLGARSMVAVPLCGREHVVGLLEAFSVDAYAFNDSDVRSLELLAELILGALKPEEEEQLARAAKAATIRSSARVGSVEIARETAATASAADHGIVESLVEAGPSPFREKQVDSENVPVLFAEFEHRQPPRPGLAVVAAVVIIASLFAGGLWWKISRSPRNITKAAISGNPQATPPASEVGANGATRTGGGWTQPGSGSSEMVEDVPAKPESAETKLTDAQLAVLPKVTGLRHWSSANASTVVIDLQDQVQYEAHRLSEPERIYFDLHDTVLASELEGRIIEIGDALVSRVRVAQPVAGVTRVVLETKGDSNFAVSLEPNPYRLIVELREMAPGPSASKPKSELFLPPSKPSKNVATLPQVAHSDDAAAGAHVPKFRIVVDAGHGGWDLGTVGRKGLLEKDLVLDISQRLGQMLESRLGSDVIYTRRDDNYISLDQRADLANQAQADLFVSIHANYSDLPSARGVETYYTNFFSPPGSREIEKRENGNLKQAAVPVNLSSLALREKVEESRRLAADVQKALYGTLARQSPSIRNRGVKEASFVVLTGTAMPSILAEVSFVSSPDDETNLQSAEYRQAIAEALCKGIARYAASAHRVKMASASAKPAVGGGQ
jgi:N-acetylmuramoyl-L-alanine amidase